MARLGDVCDVRDGTHDSPVYIDRGFPLVTSKNIINGKLDLSVVNYISPEDYNKINERSNVECGDIIMPMIGTIGNPYIVGDFSDFAIKNVALIKFNNEQINNKYIYHFLNSEKFNKYVAENNRGGTQKFLSLKDIRNLEVEVPSLKEQLIIIEKLDGLNELILSRKQQLSKLDELVKARFIEMFANEENKVCLIDLCKFINGDRGKNYPSGSDIVSRGIPFINAGHLEQNRISFDDMNYLTEDKYNSLNSGKIQKNDILYCLRGSLGKKALVDIDKGAIASSLVIMRPDTEKIIPIFLLYSLEQPYIIEQMNKANNGSSQPNLSAQSVKAYEIILPPIELQNEFAAFVKQIDKSKFEVQQSLEKLETLKKSLMQQYFG